MSRRDEQRRWKDEASGGSDAPGALGARDADLGRVEGSGSGIRNCADKDVSRARRLVADAEDPQVPAASAARVFRRVERTIALQAPAWRRIAWAVSAAAVAGAIAFVATRRDAVTSDREAAGFFVLKRASGGAVEIIDRAGSPVTARSRHTLGDGDRIVTHARASAEIAVGKGCRFRVAQESEVAFTAIDRSESQDFGIELLRGAVGVSIGAEEEGARLGIVAGRFAIGSRGDGVEASIALRSDAPGEVEVEAKQGTLFVQGPSERIELRAGDRFRSLPPPRESAAARVGGAPVVGSKVVDHASNASSAPSGEVRAQRADSKPNVEASALSGEARAQSPDSKQASAPSGEARAQNTHSKPNFEASALSGEGRARKASSAPSIEARAPSAAAPSATSQPRRLNRVMRTLEHGTHASQLADRSRAEKEASASTDGAPKEGPERNENRGDLDRSTRTDEGARQPASRSGELGATGDETAARFAPATAVVPNAAIAPNSAPGSPARDTAQASHAPNSAPGSPAPNTAPSPPARAPREDDLALLYQRAREEPVPARAIALFDQVARRESPFAEIAAHQAARLAMRSGHCPDAIPRFERLLDRYPAGVYAQESRLDLLECRLKLGNLDQAAADLESFLEHHPTSERSPELLFLRGELHRRGGDCKSALRDYAATGGSRRAADGLYFKAWCLAQLGEKDKAKAAFDIYVSRWPGGAHARDAREALSRLGSGSNVR